MNGILWLGSIGLVIRIAHKLLGLIVLWWRKEYRSDRMIIHLKTRQGRLLFFGKTNVVFFLLVLLGLAPAYRPSAVLLVSIAAIVIAVQYIRERNHWLIPRISPKVLAIGAGVIATGGWFVWTSMLPVVYALAIVEVFLFPLTWGLVILSNIPVYLYHRWVIRRAVGMLRDHTPMAVIGVTGSFGKTSVKEYLAEILRLKYPTLKTEASKNAPVGISEAIIRHIRPEHAIFVVEMAAYKRGEIREMTEMVRPEIGIVTAINAQHQDLFGSIENTVTAKYERVQGLVGRRMLIANADDTRVRDMGKRAEKEGCTVWWYTTKTGNREEGSGNRKTKIFRAIHIRSDFSGIEFDCVLGKETVPVKAPVLGEFQAGNILAGIAGAVAAGMTLTEAAHAASQVKPAAHTMEVVKGVNGSRFIDDTFNNNPDAAIAAVTFLGKNAGKKILVFQPMIELGKYAESSHEEVGRVSAGYATAIFLTNGNFRQSFERGVRKVSDTVPCAVGTPAAIADFVRKNVGSGDVVLFKGKDAMHALRLLQSSER